MTIPSASSSLEIHLLGSFLIRVDGQPVEDQRWSRRSAKLLVKLLALQPRHQLHREQIIELLWPNLELDPAINELNKALHAARRALEPELPAASASRFLLTQQQQLVLRAPDGPFVDAAAFAQQAADALKSVVADDIEAALALYEGDLLVEDPYEDWAAAQRESLRAAYHQLLSRLSSLYEAERAYEPSIECLKKLVAVEPCNENTHRRLMRLYATTGNKFLARQQYEQCRKILRDDLDADPDPETIELSKLIMLNQFQLPAPESPTIDSNSPAQMARPVEARSAALQVGDTPAPEQEDRGEWQEDLQPRIATVPATQDATGFLPRPHPRFSRRLYVLVTCAVLLGLLAVSGLWRLNRRSDIHDAAVIDSLAIVPFVNGSGDPETDYLADGISENIANSLSQMGSARVIARSTMARFKGRESDPLGVGRELKVRAVLTGRVTQHDGRLTITTELIDVSDGSLLSGETAEGALADIFAVQQQITRGLAEKLPLSATAASPRGENARASTHASETQNVESYRAYLRGRFFWNKRSEEGMAKALAYFQQSLDLDPAYARAYAGLADAYLFSGGYTLAPADGRRLAKASALKALEINETLAEAHATLAFLAEYDDWDWTTAEREYRRALALNPNYATAHHWYAEFLTFMGRFDQGIAEIERARDLDPFAVAINRDAAMIYMYVKRHDLAVERLETMIKLDARNELEGRQWLTIVYVSAGQPEKAAVQFRRAQELAGSHLAPDYVAFYYAGTGQRGEALRRLSQLEDEAKRDPQMAWTVAQSYAMLGKNDESFALLARVEQARVGSLISIKTNPFFDNLRSDPRLPELLRRINLAP